MDCRKSSRFVAGASRSATKTSTSATLTRARISARKVFWNQAVCLKGWGVRTVRASEKGSFVCEYGGEIVSTNEAKERFAEYDQLLHERPTSASHNYLLVVREHTDGDSRILRCSIDATHHGSVARFVNHSCEPNMSLVMVRAPAACLPACLPGAAKPATHSSVRRCEWAR